MSNITEDLPKMDCDEDKKEDKITLSHQSDYEKELEKYSQEKVHIPQTNIQTNQTLKPKSDVIFLKLFPDEHPLSSEEQMFFIKVTEGIFGYNEQIRNETIKMLSVDYNITTITPYLCLFIKEAIFTNIVLTDLTLLIYSVRMTKCLLCNPHVNLKEHIHHILPAIISCGVAKKISKYYYDNHWTLRDFSAYVVAMICHMYNTKLNNITQRVINIYMQAIQDLSKPLTSVYGALKGLSSFGEEVTKTHIFPNIQFLSKRIFVVLEKKIIYPEDKQFIIEAKHVRDVFINILSPVLYKTQNTNDGGATYIKEFGCLGKLLYFQVKNLERAELEKKISNNNYMYLVNSSVNG